MKRLGGRLGATPPLVQILRQDRRKPGGFAEGRVLMGKKQPVGGKPVPLGQNAQARQLSVEDIRRTIKDGRAAGETLPAEDIFGHLEDKLRRL
jgi:hypothetical protein